MGDAAEKLSGKLGLDSTDFKAAISSANRELRVLESSFRASAASLGDWSKDASGLESRIKTLNSSIDIQRLKVDALREEHARLSEANGAGSKAAQDAEIKLNKETETLNKMSLELSNTTGALEAMQQGSQGAGDAVSGMGEQVDAASEQVVDFGSVLDGIGGILSATTALVVGLATAAVGTVVALSGLMLQTADSADAMADLSAKSGISVERLQELEYVGGILGTSLDTITSSQSRLIRSMDAAREGTGAQAEAFAALGINVLDAGGQLRNQQDVFAEAVDALGQVESVAERDALAMQIFGKSAQELNPLIIAGSDEIARLSQEAQDVGAVVSGETVDGFATLADTVFGLQQGFEGIVTSLLSNFLPGFQSVFDEAGGYLETFNEIVSGSDGDFGALAEGLVGLISQIASDVAQQAPALLESGLAILQTILDAITTALPSMIPVAIEIVTSLIDFIVGNLPALISAGVPILLTLVNAIIANLPMLITAALGAIIALANGLADNLPVLIPAIVEAVLLIVETLIANVPMLVEGAVALILGLAQGLIAAIPILLPRIPEIVGAIFDALIAAAPIIGNAAIELIQALQLGFYANLPLLGESAVQLIDEFVKGVNNLRSKLIEVGYSVLEGVWQGILQNSDYFFGQIADFFTGIVDAAEEALGIESPSKEGMLIGQNFMGATVLGAEKALREVESAFYNMTGRLVVASAEATGDIAAQNVSNNNSVDVWGNVIIQGDTPAGSLGASLRGRRF